MKKKILICGATGFIGRNIAEHFRQLDDFEVFGTYFKTVPSGYDGITMIKADLTRKEDVDKLLKGKNIIIQAAAATSGAKEIITKPYYHVTDNALMNALIFRAAFDFKVSHVVFFSCTTMYQSSDIPVKETDFDANKEINSIYFGGAWTKVYNEKMCEFYSRISQAEYTVIRHSNIYGPYDKFDLEKSHVFGATVRKVISAKEKEKIVVWGLGEEERDLLYVSDLVDFVSLAIDRQTSSFGLFNVGYGSSISVSELVKKIIACSGKNIKIKYDLSKPSIKTKVCLDAAKAKNTFGWQPKISLDKGIRMTMDWYRANIKI